MRNHAGFHCRLLLPVQNPDISYNARPSNQQQQNSKYPRSIQRHISRNPTKSLGSIHISSIPNPIQNREYPITRFIVHPAKKDAYSILYAPSPHCIYFSSTDSERIFSISSFACSCASASPFFLLVNLLTKSGTISRIFVIPS